MTGIYYVKLFSIKKSWGLGRGLSWWNVSHRSMICRDRQIPRTQGSVTPVESRPSHSVRDPISENKVHSNWGRQTLTCSLYTHVHACSFIPIYTLTYRQKQLVTHITCMWHINSYMHIEKQFGSLKFHKEMTLVMVLYNGQIFIDHALVKQVNGLESRTTVSLHWVIHQAIGHRSWHSEHFPQACEALRSQNLMVPECSQFCHSNVHNCRS